MSPHAKLALTSSVPAVALVVYLATLEWIPRLPFDVLGIAWLLMNLPLLAGWVVAALLIGVAVYCWLMALRVQR